MGLLLGWSGQEAPRGDPESRGLHIPWTCRLPPLDHGCLRTVVFYTHVLNRDGLGPPSRVVSASVKKVNRVAG